MPFPHEQTIEVSPTAREVLEAVFRRHSTPQQLAQRALLVLTLADCYSQADAAAETGLGPESVRTWRSRWLSGQEAIIALGDDAKAVEAKIAEVLSDEARPGTPPTFTPEQAALIQAMACETPPKEVGTHWSCKTLAEEAVRRRIVTTISHQSVWRFLKSGRPQAS